jgi:GTP cyclohydrolase I
MTSTIPAISNETLTSLNAGVQPVSQRIRQRLVDQGISFLANDNVAAFIETGELDELEHEVADRVRELLRSLVIDIDNDHNTAETGRACGSDVSP